MRAEEMFRCGTKGHLVGKWLEWMILVVFSNLDDAVILSSSTEIFVTRSHFQQGFALSSRTKIIGALRG